jgi:parallel beta-helix repeat protein
MKAIFRTLPLFSLFACALSGGVAQAATYYAATNGSDARSCTTAQTISSPKGSVNSGMSCLQAGDTLLVRGGTYNEGIIDTPLAGTSWTNMVRIAAYPGETVWLNPQPGVAGSDYVIYLAAYQQYVEFDGINLKATGNDRRGRMSIQAWANGDPHHIRFKNAEIIQGGNGIPNEFTNSNDLGISAYSTRANATGYYEFINITAHGTHDAGDLSAGFYINASNVLIDGCNIYDQNGEGIQLYSAHPEGGPPTGGIVRNCVIHDITVKVTNEIFGLLIDGQGNSAYNNVITNNGGHGIELYGGASTGNFIYNNTVYGNTGSGIFAVSGTSGNTFENNISYGNGTNFTDQASGTVSSNNLFGPNPMFVNAAAGNFQLTSSSPARDTGATLTMVAVDMLGVARPQNGAYDMGAYEFKVTAPPPAAPVGFHFVP